MSDRDPFSTDANSGEHDPLRPRPPQATWHEVDATLARGIIYRLAGFFTQADIARLDRRLVFLHQRQPAVEYRHTASCQARRSPQPKVYLLDCGEANGADDLQAEIEVEITAGKPVGLRFLSLRLPGDANLLQPQVIGLKKADGRLAIRVAHHSGMSLRLANGDRMASVLLRLPENPLDDDSEIEFRVAAESAILDDALAKMLDLNTAGGSLSPAVFRRQAILQELMPLLGMPQLDWPGVVTREARRTKPTSPRLDGALSLLEPYCAPCHGDAGLHPPGFLAGENTLSRVSQCAARMLQRLRAWQTDSGYAHAPMPPPASIGFSGSSAAEWAHSDHYRSLVESLERLLPPELKTEWQKQAYADLPACLEPSVE